jgi:hypothetical protein
MENCVFNIISLQQFREDKTVIEAPIWLEISDCSYSETRIALTKNTRKK